MAGTKDSKNGLVKDASGRSLTRQDLDEMVSIATEMELVDAKEAGALGFMAHHLVVTTLPHSKLVGPDGKELREYTKHNGKLHLGFQAGMEAMPGTGVPYGVYPRLVMIRVATEAVRTQEREIDFGGSMEEFAKMIGIDGGVGYGKRGVGTEIQRQAFRLFTGSLSTWTGDDDHFEFENYKLADHGSIWWDPKHPAQKSLWRSKITLSERAFYEMTRRAIPMDLRALQDKTLHPAHWPSTSTSGCPTGATRRRRRP